MARAISCTILSLKWRKKWLRDHFLPSALLTSSKSTSESYGHVSPGIFTPRSRATSRALS